MNNSMCLPTVSPLPVRSRHLPSTHLFLPLPVPPNRLPSPPTAAYACPPPPISSYRCLLCLLIASYLFLPLPPMPAHRLLSLSTAACACPPPPNFFYRCLCLPTASQLIMLLHSRADNPWVGLTTHANFDWIFLFKVKNSWVDNQALLRLYPEKRSYFSGASPCLSVVLTTIHLDDFK